jgi:hypothetical protein
VRLFLDQDVYGVTAKLLIDLGHDIVRAADIGLAEAEDARFIENGSRTRQNICDARP